MPGSVQSPFLAGTRKAAIVGDLASALAWTQDEAELVTELQGGSDAAFGWLVYR